jgi:DNA repair protein RecO (recombination protein O)
VFNLLCRKLSLLDERPDGATKAAALAFRLKLLLAAGLCPQLGACVSCGEHEHLIGFSPAGGGVVCSSCEAASFPLSQEAYDFMVKCIGSPLAQAPGNVDPFLGQVERAISETLEHHAHLRLMPAVARGR